MKINYHYQKLTAGYLFPEIARRVNSFSEQNPHSRVIRLGIGDVTEPLPKVCRDAMVEAVHEMGEHKTFRGYGPEQGYEFLREAIARTDFQSRGCDIDSSEIFISDGSKCDSGNILDILCTDAGSNAIAVTDPVYPVYVDTNVMAGHTGPAAENGEYSGLIYLPLTADNEFTAEIPRQHVDIVYLCFPNNPTGAVATRDHLEHWVRYAQEHKALILFDAAYEAYITDQSIPHSIYEIDGARDVAIEFRSFSKNAGFTGTRCALTVVPKSLVGETPSSQEVSLHQLWSRRQATKFNGVSYIIQRGAAAVYTDEGQREVSKLVTFYLENARIIREQLGQAGMTIFGGINSPYVWLKTPGGLSSWDFFDKLLNEAHVVGTPGSGFGAAGEGYVRISAFNSRENVEEAMRRIHQRLTL